MGKCAERGILLSFYSPNGRFLCSTASPEHGNVLLRRTQYRTADSEYTRRDIAEWFMTGKLYNSRQVIERTVRDHALRVDADALKAASGAINDCIKMLHEQSDVDALRGVEGVAAQRYFDVFNEHILQNKEAFAFHGRSRRPPLDRINAVLSFVYAILANDCASALRGVGLDPYVGFMHTDRPGRESLALDLMEELRAPVADGFVITLVNNRRILPEHFDVRENGSVLMNDDGRKKVLAEWQARKQEVIVHPFLQEKVQWGLVPHCQSLLLARYLRGDLDAYPPFLWK